MSYPANFRYSREHEWISVEGNVGTIGITEGAIPFAAADPVRVIPTIVSGSAFGGMIAMLLGVGDHAPHGGPIVLPVIDHRAGFLVAILLGTLVVAIVMNILRAIQTSSTGTH